MQGHTFNTATFFIFTHDGMWNKNYSNFIDWTHKAALHYFCIKCFVRNFYLINLSFIFTSQKSIPVILNEHRNTFCKWLKHHFVRTTSFIISVYSQKIQKTIHNFIKCSVFGTARFSRKFLQTISKLHEWM